MGNRPTVKDVAALAGVSQATVSYVLNATPGQTISPATRDRVLEAVAGLGYVPSRAARALRSGSSRVILVAIASVPIGGNIAHLIETMSDLLDEHGYAVVYRRLGEASGFQRLLEALDPAAVVNLSALPAETVTWLEDRGVPCISTDSDDPPAPQVRLGRLQAAHLHERGHRRLGWAGPEGQDLALFADPRLQGVRLGCQDAGLSAPSVRRFPLTRAACLEAVEGWLAEGVTAVAAYNDEFAIGLAGALLARGYRAPAGLAVIGIDDLPMAALVSPSLTTLDLHNDATARSASHQVLKALGVDTPPTDREDQATLVQREST